ncbi:MAG TPA: septation protein SepH, partial [Rugosimonospora sp.]|nr:septation protein SepH [Rugosimonospora sp.]
MRPVRFVALSEDGQAFVLADEVGRLLALPIDERVHSAIRTEPGRGGTAPVSLAGADPAVALSPRDIQARIRAGESADEVARVAGVPVDRVLRYAGPVLQERAMLAQHARRTKLKSSDKGASLAEVVDGRLAQHGVDAEKISWDAYRRDDGTWRVVATWPSGKATAQAIWDLDKSRQLVTPHDDMAQYLCTERPAPILGQEPPLVERPGRGLAAPVRGEGGRGDL